MSDVDGNRLQPDRPEELPEQERGRPRVPLEDVLEPFQPLSDPLDRWCPEDLLPGRAQTFRVLGEVFDPTFRLDEGLAQRATPAAPPTNSMKFARRRSSDASSTSLSRMVSGRSDLCSVTAFDPREDALNLGGVREPDRGRRPVRGSRRLSERFQTQRPAYFSLSRFRLTVAGDQPLLLRIRPGTPSLFSCLTMPVSDNPWA